MTEKRLLVLGFCTIVLVSIAGKLDAAPAGIEVSVAQDLNSLFGDTIDEGDREASVRWKTVNGTAVPRVQCVEDETAPNGRYICEAEIEVKVDEGEGGVTTCSDLPYEWRDGEAVRIDVGPESAFDSCLEDLSSVE